MEVYLPDLSALSREVGSRHIALTDTRFENLNADELAHVMHQSLLIIDNPANGLIQTPVGSANSLEYLRQLCAQFTTYQLTTRNVGAAGEALLLPLLEMANLMQIDPIETAQRRTPPHVENNTGYYLRILRLVKQRCKFVNAMPALNEPILPGDYQRRRTVHFAGRRALNDPDDAMTIHERVARALWFCKRGERNTIWLVMRDLIVQDLASTNATVHAMHPNAPGMVQDTALGHIITCHATVSWPRRISPFLQSTLIRIAAEYARPLAMVRLIAAFPRKLTKSDALFALESAVDNDSHAVMAALLSTDANGACVLKNENEEDADDSLRVHAVDMQKALTDVAFTASKAQILYQPFSGTGVFEQLERAQLDTARVLRLKRMIGSGARHNPANIAALAAIPNYPLNAVLLHELIDTMLGNNAPRNRAELVPLAIHLANLVTNDTDTKTLLAMSGIPEFLAWRSAFPGPYPTLLPPNA